MRNLLPPNFTTKFSRAELFLIKNVLDKTVKEFIIVDWGEVFLIGVERRKISTIRNQSL